jgi:hypothetical protein
MNIYNATYVALLAIIIVIIIFLIPPNKYDSETGEIIRENNFSISDIIGFIIFLVLGFLSLYTINCLHSQHHFSVNSGNTGNTRNTGILGFGSTPSLAQPDNNCVYLAWFHALVLLVVAIITVASGYNAKFVNQESKNSNSLFDKLASK